MMVLFAYLLGIIIRCVRWGNEGEEAVAAREDGKNSYNDFNSVPIVMISSWSRTNVL